MAIKLYNSYFIQPLILNDASHKSLFCNSIANSRNIVRTTTDRIATLIILKNHERAMDDTV